MKKKYIWIIAFLLSYIHILAQIQKITGYEYWYDSDYAGKISQSVPPTETLNIDDAFDVASLDDGLHSLHFRFKDEREVWSASATKMFIKNSQAGSPVIQKITGYEYWYDSDYAGKVRQSVAATETLSIDEAFDIASLDDGLHSLYFRFKNESEVWSASATKMFIKNSQAGSTVIQKITGYEYWYDSDYTGKISQSIPPTETLNIDEAFDVASLDDGLHSLHFRFKDARNVWSASATKMFIKNSQAGSTAIQKIIGYEYWYDNDYAGKVSQSVAPIEALSIDDAFDVALLDDGLHTVHFRFKDKRNVWSASATKMFIKNSQPVSAAIQKIVAYRYWIDTDKTTLITKTLDTPTEVYALDDSISTDLRLTGGEHTVSYQFQDERGQWNSPASGTFLYPYGDPEATLSASSNPGCAGMEITFSAELTEANAITWDFGDGSATSTELSPVHTYRKEGTYTVTASISHTVSGKTGSASMEITVYPTYSTPPSTDQLVAHYSLNGNANDISGNGHNGTANNIVSATDRKGNANSAIEFNGTNSYIWAENHDDFNVEAGESFSVSFWFKSKDTSSYGWILSHRYRENVGYEIYYYNGKAKVVFKFNSNRVYFVESTTEINDQQWHHVTAVFESGKSFRIYVDGILEEEKATTENNRIVYPISLLIGCDSYNQYLNGTLDEVKLFKKVLTEAEIQREISNASNLLPPRSEVICASETPYTFGTQQLTESGIYSETFQTVHGCDSVVTLDLTVNPTYNIVIDKYVTETPYQFGSQNLTETGSYTQTFQTVNGCDSVVTLNLSVESTQSPITLQPTTNTAVTGDLLHAAGGSDFIGVVYSNSAGEIFYNRLGTDGAWATETSLGTGSQARIVIDKNNHPHVVYKTSDNKIAYLKHNGASWSTPEYLESNNGAGCASPDIDVDANGSAHIVYSDTRWDSDSYAEIIYAENNSGNFVKTLLFDGDYYYSSGSGSGDYYQKGAKITLDKDANYFVIAHNHGFISGGFGGADHWYSLKLKSNLGNGGVSCASGDNVFDLELARDTVCALYSSSGFKSSKISVSSNNTLSLTTTDEITASSVSTLSANPLHRVVGGISSGKLLTKFNDLSHTFDNISVKGSNVDVVELHTGVFYVVYTDNVDGVIKTLLVPKPLSFTAFSFAEQTGAAFIDPQAGTIAIEVAEGKDASNLTATYATTTDVTNVQVQNGMRAARALGTMTEDFSAARTVTLSDGGSQTRDWTVNVSVKNYTKHDEIDEKQVAVYPNPFDGEIYFEGAANIARVQLTNLSGQIVIDTSLHGRDKLRVSDVRKGIYMLTIELHDGSRIIHKMIKD